VLRIVQGDRAVLEGTSEAGATSPLNGTVMRSVTGRLLKQPAAKDGADNVLRVVQCNRAVQVLDMANEARPFKTVMPAPRGAVC
jgi:hypothetical protein